MVLGNRRYAPRAVTEKGRDVPLPYPKSSPFPCWHCLELFDTPPVMVVTEQGTFHGNFDCASCMLRWCAEHTKFNRGEVKARSLAFLKSIGAVSSITRVPMAPEQCLLHRLGGSIHGKDFPHVGVITGHVDHKFIPNITGITLQPPSVASRTARKAIALPACDVDKRHCGVIRPDPKCTFQLSLEVDRVEGGEAEDVQGEEREGGAAGARVEPRGSGARPAADETRVIEEGSLQGRLKVIQNRPKYMFTKRGEGAYLEYVRQRRMGIPHEKIVLSDPNVMLGTPVPSNVSQRILKPPKFKTKGPKKAKIAPGKKPRAATRAANRNA
jgi:hypothetical protein